MENFISFFKYPKCFLNFIFVLNFNPLKRSNKLFNLKIKWKLKRRVFMFKTCSYLKTKRRTSKKRGSIRCVLLLLFYLKWAMNANKKGRKKSKCQYFMFVCVFFCLFKLFLMFQNAPIQSFFLCLFLSNSTRWLFNYNLRLFSPCLLEFIRFYVHYLGSIHGQINNSRFGYFIFYFQIEKTIISTRQRSENIRLDK